MPIDVFNTTGYGTHIMILNIKTIVLMGLLLLVLCFLLTGCIVPPGQVRGSQSVNESPKEGACRQARSFYQACYFSCIGSTAGGVMYAANLCGTKCSEEKSEITRACY